MSSSVVKPQGKVRASDPTANRDAAERILAAFQGPVEPVQIPVAYRAGILLVTFLMVLLPLIYVGIIAAVGYAVLVHAQNNTFLLETRGGGGRGQMAALMAYLAPMICGGILVVFMLKPFFSRAPKREETLSLKRDDEPLLFAFVDRICDVVGAPRPRRIDVDCQVNASASFRHGLWSMLGSDLVLTIGLPLVSGLTLRQFAGVLAHEFGHFSQSAGMRLTYVIRSINLWFARVVYERDAWDEQLSAWAKGVDLRIGWVLYLAMFFVWLTRKLLYGLMIVGHAVSGFMSRQMEFDADRYEARLAGSDTFAATARQLILLNIAFRGALSDLSDFLREGRLADDLPALVLHNAQGLPPEALEYVNKMQAESKTGWFDTHPADKDRIASAAREQSAGVFRLEEPAGTCFRDFGKQCRGVTLDFYRQQLGEEFRQEAVQPLQELLSRQNEEQVTFAALKRAYGDDYYAIRPVAIPDGSPAAPEESAAAAARLVALRGEIEVLKAAYSPAAKTFDELDTQFLETHRADALLQAGFNIQPGNFSQSLTSSSRIVAARREVREKQGELNARLAAFEEAMGRRIVLAVQLLDSPAVASSLPDAAAWRKESRRLLPVLRLLDEQLPLLQELRDGQSRVNVLFQNFEGHEEDAKLRERILHELREVTNAIHAVHKVLKSQPYPFEHARGEITLASFAIEKLPASDQPGDVFEAAGRLLDQVFRLRARIVGRLCVFADEVERVMAPAPATANVAEPAVGEV